MMKLKLDRTETSMIKQMWVYSEKMEKYRTHSENSLELETVSLVIRKGRLRWFGHVECNNDGE